MSRSMRAAPSSMPRDMQADRKSTRLNSSHGSISYAGFCWKKKDLAKRVDQSDRDAGFSLQRPEVSEERGDLTGYIFVDGMDSHQRIEYEQNRAMEEARGL